MKLDKKYWVIIINVVFLIIFISLLAINYYMENEIQALTYIALTGLLFQTYYLVKKISTDNKK